MGRRNQRPFPILKDSVEIATSYVLLIVCLSSEYPGPPSIAVSLYEFCKRWEWGLAVACREMGAGLAVLPVIGLTAVSGACVRALCI